MLCIVYLLYYVNKHQERKKIYIYFRKRKIMENMLQNTPNCTIDKKSGEYAPIPLNIMCIVIHYLVFLYKK